MADNRSFEKFVTRVWNILSKDEMSNKEFTTYYINDYKKVKDVIIPNPYDTFQNLPSRYNFPATLKEVTNRFVQSGIIDRLLDTTYGQSLARCIEIVSTCYLPECLCKLMKYWLLSLVNSSFGSSIKQIKKIIYVCWEIYNKIDDTVPMKSTLIKVFFRIINMILKQHGIVATYCVKIGILKILNTNSRFAIYTFTWNNYKTKVYLSQLRMCAFCGKYDVNGTCKTCSGCKKACYCNEECQKKDWKPSHKIICCPKN